MGAPRSHDGSAAVTVLNKLHRLDQKEKGGGKKQTHYCSRTNMSSERVQSCVLMENRSHSAMSCACSENKD